MIKFNQRTCYEIITPVSELQRSINGIAGSSLTTFIIINRRLNIYLYFTSPLTIETFLSDPIVLVRLKRSPNRAFTFSGFNPSTGLSAFATGADFLPSFYRYAPAPPSPSFAQEARESYLPSAESDSTYDYPPSVENLSPNGGDEDRKIPSQNLSPPAETALNTGYNANSNANAIQGVKKPKKKPNRVNPAPIQEEEDGEGKIVIFKVSERLKF